MLSSVAALPRKGSSVSLRFGTTPDGRDERQASAICFRDVLPDAPQDTSRVNDNEVSNAPRPVGWWFHLHSILGS